jgi:hypothetical protein
MTVRKDRVWPLKSAGFSPCGERTNLPFASAQVLLLRNLENIHSVSGGDVPTHDIWKDMFVLGLPLLEKILRPIIV